MFDETSDFGDRPEVCALVARQSRPVSYAGPGRNRVKRLIDVVVAAALCVAMLPLLLVIAVVIKLDFRVQFFCQNRRGLNGIPFRIYKFRTMYVQAQDDHGAERKVPLSAGRSIWIILAQVQPG